MVRFAQQHFYTFVILFDVDLFYLHCYKMLVHPMYKTKSRSHPRTSCEASVVWFFSVQCSSGGRNLKQIRSFRCFLAVASQHLSKIKPGEHRQKVWFVLQWSECSSHRVHRFTSECTPGSGCHRCNCSVTQIKAVTQNKRHCVTRNSTYGTNKSVWQSAMWMLTEPNG